jgi:predicted RNA-binding protein YlxR (DUF448 family)
VAPKAELIRIAIQPPGDAGGEPRAVLDRDSSMPGRGTYLCRAVNMEPADACLALALRRGGIQRGLRRKVRVDFKLVESVGP